MEGSPLVTSAGSTTQLTAMIPATLYASPVAAKITVLSGGHVSNSLTFSVLVPPQWTSVSPGSAIVGSPGLTLTINGSGFALDAIVWISGVQLKTTFISSTQLMAFLPASLTAAPGWIQIEVQNPSAGTGSKFGSVLRRPSSPDHFFESEFRGGGKRWFHPMGDWHGFQFRCNRTDHFGRGPKDDSYAGSGYRYRGDAHCVCTGKRHRNPGNLLCLGGHGRGDLAIISVSPAVSNLSVITNSPLPVGTVGTPYSLRSGRNGRNHALQGLVDRERQPASGHLAFGH